MSVQWPLHTETHKPCTACGILKPRTEFARASGKCRPCRSAVNVAYQRANRDKHSAHQVVRRALMRGAITKPLFCEDCGAGGRLESHHEDYTRPLAIAWLCASCHRRKG